jgi:hypothetical protein
MFASLKDVGKNKFKTNAIALFTFIVNSTKGPAGGGYAPLADAQKVLKAEPTFITINEQLKDPSGNVFISATAAGIAAIDGPAAGATGGPVPPVVPPNAVPQAGAIPSVSTSKFSLEKGIGIPATKRGGMKGETYPFSQMEVGDSFFVPATEKRPDPAKALGSTLFSAALRFATKVVGQTRTNKKGREVPVYTFSRKFKVRPVAAVAATDTTPAQPAGARIWRTE